MLSPGPHPVLVVEDNPYTSEAIVRLLGLRGYNAVPVYDGQEALDYFRTGGTAAVILLDMRMSGMDGHTFRAAQLADPRLADIPVIVYTAQGDPAMPGVPFLRKSADPERLLDLVAAYCPAA